ncbi:glycosyltransferase [Candidatus Bathyarchaeota archaeon]|nr:glycosyltransferase [Candidatus Bathyarchaeota archaeon]
MKVLVIAPNDLRIYEGTTVRVTGLTKGISKYVEAVYLASRSLNKELRNAPKLKWLRLKFYRSLTETPLCCINTVLGDNTCKLFLNIFTNTKELERYIDIIYSHFITTLPLALGFKHALDDPPLLIDLHGLYCLQLTKFKLNPIGHMLTHLYTMYEALKLSDEHISGYTLPSQAFKEIVIRCFKIPEWKVHIVPDGLDISSVPHYNEETVERIRQHIGIYDKIVVTYVGTPSYYHGFYDLLQAYKIARKLEQRVFLLLIVPSKDFVIKKLLEAGIDLNDVYVLDSIPRSEVYKYLYASDILVLPHRKGTQFDYLPSNKLLDYIASGRPIISYALPSIFPLLKRYPLKVLVKPNDPRELANGILEAAKFYRGVHINGKQYVKEYDWSNICKVLFQIYTMLLKTV